MAGFSVDDSRQVLLLAFASFTQLVLEGKTPPSISPCHMSELDPTKAVLKLGFRNAFNSIRRDKMLRAVLGLAPGLFHYAHSAYSLSSTVFWADRVSRRCATRRSMGATFLLAYHSQHVFSTGVGIDYLDDSTLGGSVEDLWHNLEVVEQMGAEIGLKLIVRSLKSYASILTSRIPSYNAKARRSL